MCVVYVCIFEHWDCSTELKSESITPVVIYNFTLTVVMSGVAVTVVMNIGPNTFWVRGHRAPPIASFNTRVLQQKAGE